MAVLKSKQVKASDNATDMYIEGDDETIETRFSARLHSLSGNANLLSNS